MSSAAVLEERVFLLNQLPPKPDADFVLYWMIAARRTRSNFALQRAVQWANDLGKPLVVLEPLRAGYPWASSRLHTFVVQGMVDNAAAFARSRARYLPWLEPSAGAGRGLLEALAERAAVVVTDHFPAFFLPRMVAAAAAKLPVRFEAVDANGLIPLSLTSRVFPTAALFRRFVQANAPAQLERFPVDNPLDLLEADSASLVLPDLGAWPIAELRGGHPSVASIVGRLPVPATPGPVSLVGGAVAGKARLAAWLRDGLPRYGEERSRPDVDVASGLSPWLHFGHVGLHEVLGAVIAAERWNGWAAPPKVTGARAGFWGMSPSAESFIDELVTWREVGFNFSHNLPDTYDRYESLPEWARATLGKHAADRRPWTYTLEELDRGATHDPLWNAAQRELTEDGRMHNYLRMLWGKKILEWSPSPEAALAAMIELNNRYALDGRDPNSYSGIFWTLGRYDRPWGPERDIFGTIRYMSSDNTARKFDVKPYLARFGAHRPGQLGLL